MKLKLRNLESHVNPLPVMSKDAFIAFAKDWFDYVDSLGLKAKGKIRLPGIEYYHTKTYTYKKNRGWFSVGDLWEMGKIDGYISHLTDLDQPQVPMDYSVLITKDTLKYPSDCGIRNDCGVEELVNAELSENFAFTQLIQLDTKTVRELNSKIGKNKLNLTAEEIIAATRKMVYERSALIRRGIFGGYYLTQ